MTETPFSDIPCNNIASKNKGEINFEQVFLPSSEEEEKIEKIIIKITKDNSIYQILGISCFVLLTFSLYTMVLIPRIVLMIVLIYIIIIALSLLFIYLFSENKLALSRNDKTRKLLVEKINHFGCLNCGKLPKNKIFYLIKKYHNKKQLHFLCTNCKTNCNNICPVCNTQIDENDYIEIPLEPNNTKE